MLWRDSDVSRAARKAFGPRAWNTWCNRRLLEWKKNRFHVVRDTATHDGCGTGEAAVREREQPLGGAICGEINLVPVDGIDLLLANADSEYVIPRAEAQAAARRS